tara:strand:- start:408 stop:788 length:381 start_codon:yes stop_codon:yes gene_type:complete
MRDITNDYAQANPDAVYDDNEVIERILAEGPPYTRWGREVELLEAEKNEWEQLWRKARLDKFQEVIDTFTGDETYDSRQIYNTLLDSLDKNINYHNESSKKAEELKKLILGEPIEFPDDDTEEPEE